MMKWREPSWTDKPSASSFRRFEEILTHWKSSSDFKCLWQSTNSNSLTETRLFPFSLTAIFLLLLFVLKQLRSFIATSGLTNFQCAGRRLSDPVTLILTLWDADFRLNGIRLSGLSSPRLHRLMLNIWHWISSFFIRKGWWRGFSVKISKIAKFSTFYYFSYSHLLIWLIIIELI